MATPDFVLSAPLLHVSSFITLVLFKSDKINKSAAFMQAFLDMLSKLDGNELERIAKLTDNATLQKAYSYFKEKENAKLWRKDLTDTINAVNARTGITDDFWEHRSFKES